MMTLEHAKRAVNDARLLNTLEAWRDAALAFEAIATGKPSRFKPAPAPAVALPKRSARPKAEKPLKEARHTGSSPILHVARCTLADGFTVRVSCGQFRGETVSDSLARFSRFTIGCWRNEHQKMPGARKRAKELRKHAKMLLKEKIDPALTEEASKILLFSNKQIAKRYVAEAERWEHLAKHGGRAPVAVGIGDVDYTIPHPEIVDLRIVKWGAGPDAGIDLEEAAAIAAE